MPNEDRLSEKWPWNGEFLRLALIVPGTGGLVATMVALPFAGLHALWFLSAIVAGFVLYAMFGVVGSKVAALERAAEGEDGECVQALVVIGKLESPGIALLHGSRLHLRPIVGAGVTINLNEVLIVREGRWLPGKFVWGKRAFNLGVPSKKRLGFAVAESVGKRWSPAIRGIE